jgi:hypothetical protein
MRTHLFFIFLLLLGSHGAAQELAGTDHTPLGTLASFEVVPAQEASWYIVPPLPNDGTYQVDTGLSKLYFASPIQGRYTVVAGILLEGKPQLLVKTFFNGEEDCKPIPSPILPVLPLESWIKTQIPILVKSENLASEIQSVARCFAKTVHQIDAGNITTAHNARTQIQITLTETLALASPTAVADWTPFLTELSRQLEQELGRSITDLTEVKKILRTISETMKSLEVLKSISTHSQKIDNPFHRGTPNRIFRNLLVK